MNTVRIVPIQMAHAEGFHAALDVVARERRYLAQLQAMPLERVQAFVQENIAADVPQVVALAGDTLVGWADICSPWQPTRAHTGTLGMGVLPAWRGRGLGEALLRTCLAKAQAKGIVRVDLEARADNTRAIRLYERVGFRHEAVKRRALCFDGRYFDAVQMVLFTDEAAPAGGA